MVKSKYIFNIKVHSHCEVGNSMIAHSLLENTGRASQVDRSVGE